MGPDPPVGKVKGQYSGKKDDQKEDDSRVLVLPDEVEESVCIRQSQMILPFLERLLWAAPKSLLAQILTNSNGWVVFSPDRAWKRHNSGCVFGL